MRRMLYAIVQRTIRKIVVTYGVRRRRATSSRWKLSSRKF
nr:MAG TPA: hypothetical protein [Caudoviricetes sp.]